MKKTKWNKSSKTLKLKEYLSYMHTSNKRCIVCLSENIELHHLLFGSMNNGKIYDNLIMPLCSEHHRGTKLSPHGNPKMYYKTYSVSQQIRTSVLYFQRWCDSQEITKYSMLNKDLFKCNTLLEVDKIMIDWLKNE